MALTASTRSRPLSQVLRVLAATPAERISLRDVMAEVGPHAHGAAIFLLSLPEAMPLPVPSASAILGVPLVVIAAHLAIFGEGSGLPARIRGWAVPAETVRAVAARVAPVLGRAERMSHPRWHALAERERLIGAVSLFLSLTLLLPIPFMNMAPATCLALLAWGMIQRDGAFVLAGLIGTAALTLVLLVLAIWAVGLVDS